MDKKYFHELSDEEYQSEIIDSNLTYNDLLERYKQPDWCGYPEAINGVMGCWALFFRQHPITIESCNKCDCFKFTGWTHEIPRNAGNYWFIGDPFGTKEHKLYLVTIHKTRNGFAYVAHGNFMDNKDGWWFPVVLPPNMPEDVNVAIA